MTPSEKRISSSVDPFACEQPTRRRITLFCRVALETICVLALVVAWNHPTTKYYLGRIVSNKSSVSLKGCSASQAPSNSTFDWESITPSPKLQWTSCFSSRECARLSVPLDYSNPEGAKAALAIIKKPSVYPSTSDKYRGPIFLNPGGPGASAIDFVRNRGEMFANILGDDYDIIGFDPRSVGHTTPRFSVHLSQSEVDEWVITEPPVANATPDALARLYERNKLRGALSSEKARQNEGGEHASTAVVCRDMLQISRALGREKVMYWGFSYGTILGSTFAAMFPDNIERLVIDGVGDPEEHYSSNMASSVKDTDKGTQLFYEACVAAGPSLCPLYEPSAALIRTRVNALLSSLKTHPITGQSARNPADYGTVDYSKVLIAFFEALYKPYEKLPAFAEALAALERGDASLMLDLSPPPHVSCAECGNGGSKSKTFSFVGDESVQLSISCSDGTPVNDTLEEVEEYYRKMAALSQFGDVMSTVRILCLNWGLRAKWNYNGPFTGNTSFPLLIVTTMADPVTPVSHAEKVSSRFPGSVVLKQNSGGHCSPGSVSLCTHKTVRRYFRDGILPDEGTVCESDSQFYPSADAKRERAVAALSAEDAGLLEAVTELSRSVKVGRAGLS